MTANIELKNVKTFLPGSEETICYTATLYIDGKRTADASNDGHGGCDFYRPFDAAARERLAAAEKEFAAQTINTEYGEMNNSLETVVAGLIDDHLNAKQLSSALSRNVIFLVDNRLLQIKATARQRTAAIAHIENKYPTAKILNTMPKDEALKIFVDNA